ncbi:MAG: NADP-dependent isocitrate dehydrogenase [Sphingobacteriales bacterium]|nr:MAG: NADP-dependent isocitrate dehydrogenase [Sphingobacteriales bacterium]TAF78664.1 MAG: NADP-dependent isocitrate dehydrogenase [Sphingobacteriales bacterium]
MINTIAVAKGDGIGPEIMDAVINIFNAAAVPLDYTFVAMGKHVFEQGNSTGMTPEAKNTIEKLGILFKGPMETPKGKGMKSLNVTARKVWNTYANKRTFVSLNGVDTVFSKSGIPIDITIIRENIEDTYGGIEHMLTPDVALCRRFITRPGSLQVHKYAFDMARKKGARKVTCGHKANIMKLTDGLFLECFYEVAKDYPEIEVNDIIVDDLAMKLVVRPTDFDVVVLTNLQGDIISDLCAGLVGGLGFAPSANIGDNISIFEAVHGTAPDITGMNIANPTSLLLSGIMLLRHLGHFSHANQIENALLYTLELGAHTGDFGSKLTPSLTTTQFAQEIINNLGKIPAKGAKTNILPNQEVYTSPSIPTQNKMTALNHAATSEIMGADFFIESVEQPQQIAEKISPFLGTEFALSTMSNRGTQVYPTGSVFTECINQFRVRLEKTTTQQLTQTDILSLSAKVAEQFKICSIEWLMAYDGKKAYSLAQGQ